MTQFDEKSRQAVRGRFLAVIDAGQKLGLWDVVSVDAVLDPYTYRATAVVSHDGRSYKLFANLDNNTVTAYNESVLDYDGRAITARDILPYTSEVPKEPTASLSRDFAVVARDLARRCIHDPSWAQLIDLMRERRARNIAYAAEKRNTLELASQCLREKEITEREAERGEFAHYPEEGGRVEVGYDGERLLRLRLDRLTLEQFRAVVRVLCEEKYIK